MTNVIFSVVTHAIAIGVILGGAYAWYNAQCPVPEFIVNALTRIRGDK